LLVLVTSPVFTKQNVEKHTFHIGINPFSWIFGIYNIEVGIPFTGFLEIAGLFDYLDGETLQRLFGIGNDPYDPYDSYNPYFKWLKVGPVVRLFPSQMATGFFFSFRLMYLFFRYVEEWHDPADSIDESFHDIAFGADIGWRYIWEFDNDWGMYLQGYLGIERHVLNTKISEFFLPLLPVVGFQLGVLR
jgi:hypothetical protein